SIGKGRFGDWLNNVQDWGISRNRYWGTPLNIWECECGCRHAIGSIAELKEMSSNCPDDIELHRPWIDAVTIKCPECGGEMHRVPEVIDCWFDSGAMPFAQWHYPFENKDIFEQNFPANFISEAVDQTRGWFYSLLAESTLLFNKAPYKNVIVLGHVQDENGQKMSKSKGNAVDPFDALETYGADAIRWYFYSNSAPWLPNRFHGGAVTEGQRKFLGTLWNTYAFFVLYANIDKFDATKYTLDYSSLSVMDKWLLSKLNSLIKEVDNNLENYRITETSRVLQEFVDQLSNWYVRRSRERFWKKDMPQDKINAYMTLYTALVTLCKLSAPMIPFMTEDIYQNLVRSIDKDAPERIHLCDFPVAHEDYINKELEKYMDDVLDIVVLGRAARNASAIKNRQPIGKMYVKAFTNYSLKPQLKTVGPKYGKFLGAIKSTLAEMDGNTAVDSLDSQSYISFDVDGTEIKLEREDLLIEAAQTEGFASESDHGITVVLDTNLTDELIEEGFVREIISKIQTMRKDSDFDVMDNIEIHISGNEKIAAIMDKNADFIKDEVLALAINSDSKCDNSKEWNINGEKVFIGVERK
ncbi:MAG: class I tRNA ligase family protein, partial [Clostridia bacterium]|nr:class I tRNA ligase family protein [Clostridia bacterium]